MRKKWIRLCCAVLLCSITVLAGCGDGSTTGTEASRSDTSVGIEEQSKEETVSAAKESFSVGDQLNKPEIGEEIAVIETTQGTIKMRLFPEQAPKTVENFKKLAEQGVYDGLDFHRIIDGFMIQTGKSDHTSIYGNTFEDEFSESLLNLRGAVSMANTNQPNTNGTQFFINQTPADEFSGWENLKKGYEIYLENPSLFTQSYGSWTDMSKITTEIQDLYTKYGGNPTLDGAYSTTGLGHTVFGQVFEGMDVVDKIAKAQTDENDSPVSDDYKIIKITFTQYEG